MTRKLHIGGNVRVPGWEVIDVVPGPYVDHPGNARDLSRFADSTFGELYASHVLEHFDYRDELLATLREWNRVLAPGGIIYVSVPDLDTLSRLFLSKDLTVDEKFVVMCMIFGGHLDPHDYHVAGLNEEILYYFLLDGGFVNIRRVDNLGIFIDTSTMKYKDTPISLNMVAEKPAA